MKCILFVYKKLPNWNLWRYRVSFLQLFDFFLIFALSDSKILLHKFHFFQIHKKIFPLYSSVPWSNGRKSSKEKLFKKSVEIYLIYSTFCESNKLHSTIRSTSAIGSSFFKKIFPRGFSVFFCGTHFSLFSRFSISVSLL